MMALVNRPELAKYLDSTGKIVTDWMIFNWYTKEGMPCVRIGHRIFFRTEAVEKWLQERERVKIENPKVVACGKLRRIE